LAALQWGLREPSGFTMLVGEIGTGKTTLIHSLLDERYQGVRIASVSNPKLSFEEMLRVITAQLGVTPAGAGKLDLIQALDGFLAAQPEQVALILDEAQAISDDTLEQLRLLSNSQTAGQRRLQMVLVGQLDLARRLGRPELRQLNQRIGARALLPTLRPAEVRDYVEYRLRAYQGDIRRLFKRGALRELARERRDSAAHQRALP
jgi:general secretion pathway protein A